MSFSARNGRKKYILEVSSLLFLAQTSYFTLSLPKFVAEHLGKLKEPLCFQLYYLTRMQL